VILHPDALLVLVGALILDALIGDPDWLWRRWPHPVAWIGRLIAWGDRALNREDRSERARRAAGALALAALILLALAAGWVTETALRALPGGPAWVALAASVLLAQRSLYEHVSRVRTAFASGGVPAARRAVAMIVGRDPDSLDEAGISRAAIESTAENLSDGVVAPAFWFAILGLPGLLAYKAANTADSMIGHLSPRHRAFGWAAARFDDLLNLAPARLSGLIIALAAPLAGGRSDTALRVMWRDARLHRSPNAGWPEAAMAGALGLALGGPRLYVAGRVEEPFLHAEGRKDATPADVGRALHILVAACCLHMALCGCRPPLCSPAISRSISAPFS
jgi:adenosylcobinamide-phosphate synthase